MSDKKLAKRDLLINIADMYYIQGLSQDEIAKKITSSRSNVSRLLKICVQEKIIEFKINKATSKVSELENKVKDKFGLEHVMIIPNYENIETSKHEIGNVVAKYMQNIVEDHMKIGISWGTTLFSVVESFEVVLEHKKDIDVFQLVGGIGTSSVDSDGLELAKRLSNKLGAKPHVLNVPLLVQSKVLRDLLLEEPQIEEHFKLLKKLDIVLLGIGNVAKGHHAMYRAGYINKEDTIKLIEAGAKADLAGHQINSDGEVCVTHISDKTITTKMEDIKRAKIRVGSAVGIEKVEAIRAVLQGDFINVLAVDEIVAESLL